MVDKHTFAAELPAPNLELLVERLRHFERLNSKVGVGQICGEAANHLERLQSQSAARLKVINVKMAEIDRLRTLLVSRPHHSTPETK